MSSAFVITTWKDTMKPVALIRNLAIFCGVVGTSTSGARQVEVWPSDRLVQQADLVVLARAVSVSTCQDEWNERVFARGKFQGLETTFEVASTLKGRSEKSLKLLHFQYKPGTHPDNDGPGLVSFITKPLSIDIRIRESEADQLRELEPISQNVVSAPEYLLFLKQRDDGRYEAVSGQLDPEFSVRALLPNRLLVR
jgi:hypothetical protein